MSTLHLGDRKREPHWYANFCCDDLAACADTEVRMALPAFTRLTLPLSKSPRRTLIVGSP